MMEYKVAYTPEAPDWDELDVAEIAVPYLDTPDFYSAYAQVAYDDEKLYVHLRKVDPDPRAVSEGLYGIPCEDSCLEFFFSPIPEDERYINIEFNPKGCAYVGFGPNVETNLRMIPEAGWDDILNPEIRRTEEGWELFYTVPYDFIRRIFPAFTNPKGKELLGNFFTCADLSEPAHYLSWSPIVGEPFTFHKRHCFGILKFLK